MAQTNSKKTTQTSTEKKEKVANIPPVQVALDLIDLPRAIQIAEEAVKGIVSSPIIQSPGSTFLPQRHERNSRASR